MWHKVTDMRERTALVRNYLALRDKARQRLQTETLGESFLQEEAAKLFKPITSHQAAEIGKVTAAIERLPAPITDGTSRQALTARQNTLRGAAPTARQDTPLPVEHDDDGTSKTSASVAPTLYMNSDLGLDIETIRKHGFKLPSELNLSDIQVITDIHNEVNRINRYVLGGEKKRKATTEERKRQITAEKDALKTYSGRLRLLTQGYRLVRSSGTTATAESQGSGLKLKGNRFGSLTIDPQALQAGKLRAFDNGDNLVFEAPADVSLYNLLTKRFLKTMQYTPEAVKTFQRLAELAGLPLHGRKSKKHQLIRSSGRVEASRSEGGALQYYKDPEALVERLQLLVASKHAGNTGLDNEISAILDELLRIGAVPKNLILELNRSLL